VSLLDRFRQKRPPAPELDLLLVRRLRSVGADLTRPRPIVHFLDFGSEAGLFQSRLGIPAVVCGPGNIAQAHQPGEFIERSQLHAATAMLERLLERCACIGLPDAERR